MIELLVATGLFAAPQVGEAQQARVKTCRDTQAASFILVGGLGRPDTDRAAAATEAGEIQRVCNAAAFDMLGHAWIDPCGQLMLRMAAHAGDVADVYRGVGSADDLPSLLSPDMRAASLRCHQIIEGEQP